MPVIINSEAIHPFLPSLGTPLAIESARAEHQDIRPLEIAIINLMADKQTTERQLALWLGNTMLQVKLTFATTDTYVRDVHAGRETKNTPAEHIRKFYRAWSEIKDQKFDGLIVTGVNALKERVSDEDIWPEVQKILHWSETNVLSSMFLCWGAKAALKHFHDIESYKSKQKLFGLFEHHLVSDKTGLLFGFPDVFPVPVSRWKSPRREDILEHEALEIVADSEEGGPNIIVESAPYDRGRFLYPHRVYILNHPEYDTETLGVEYKRDSAKDSRWPLPLHYFPGDNPDRMPRNTWRHTAHIYTNWIKALYEATPYNIEDIPRAF
ncbi:homoserine O-succinyltransferase [Dongia deserti]|uniref:homoserine O-succinyltransferase n=1 Tax=Dongia deserti TaxID=2268030 RepID=UPI000E64F3D4|nr:homoserine O-succinyltransferase [Dongia deserti]